MSTFKKKQQREPRTFYIPEDAIETYLALCEEYIKECSKLSRYKLWKYIEELFPDVKKGNWRMNFDDATHPYITEYIDD